MLFEVSIQCSYFQHRLCWMLSSILQQEGDTPDILINVAYMKNDGSPTTEEVLDFFEDEGLAIKRSRYDDFRFFCKRGNSRNDALRETKADWLMFSDCDMIFPVNWFEKAKEMLQNNNSAKCLHTGRYSTKLSQTKKILSPHDYPCEVFDSHQKSVSLRKRKMANVGAGFCQIVNVDQMEKMYNRVYVSRAYDNDWSKGITKARSDLVFRKKIGRQKIRLPYLIHLQHERDSDFGKHVEIQR